MKEFDPELARFIADHRLPDTWAGQARACYLPLADWLLERMQQSGKSCFVAGVYGAQGSGKSTFADLLYRYATLAAGKSALALSLDDFYLARDERARLAATVSPLLATRGPPGTHDVDLALRTLREALALGSGESMLIPRFDKASDDRVPQADYDRITGPVDLIILEGWCLGCRPADAAGLAEPLNELERSEDRDGRWRRYVNDSIAAYQPLFGQMNALIMLRTANFDSVLRWRREQEEKLRTSKRAQGQGVMTDAEVERFVQFFERVSRNAETQVEQAADVIVTLDKDRLVQTLEYR